MERMLVGGQQRARTSTTIEKNGRLVDAHRCARTVVGGHGRTG
ncbi:hypothetical protein [Numidum massiliense]|nr:hypothetical protein [Numidum massiliense]